VIEKARALNGLQVIGALKLLQKEYDLEDDLLLLFLTLCTDNHQRKRL
jgi:hypothetical protein